MEKGKLLSLVKKLSLSYKNGLHPGNVLGTLRQNKFIKDLFGSRISGEDLAYICFLIPQEKKGRDISVAYDIMKSNLFAVSIATILEHDPNVECNSCEGAGQHGCESCMGDSYVTCDDCDGTGEVMCDECDGSGEDEEGNACDECQGGGQVSCNECGGDGNVECNSCDGTGSDECYDCSGSGEIGTNDSIKLEYFFILSWNSKFRDLFDSMEQPKVIKHETYLKLIDNSQSLLFFTDEIVDEHDDHGLIDLEDDTTVFTTIETEPKIELKDNSGNLSVRGLYL
jgi:hypothetical protein